MEEPVDQEQGAKVILSLMILVVMSVVQYFYWTGYDRTYVHLLVG